jgi:DNA polymerase-3 subunit epsilon
MRQIVLDTETTGLEPREGHRIIEIGCVELVNRRPTGNNYHQYLQPDREIDEGALAVHGISNEFLADKPRMVDVVEAFVDYVRDAELIIHNAPFDVGFINHELALLDGDWGQIEDYCTVTDSLVMARGRYPGQRNSLDALCKRLDVDNSNREYHGALLDARILADVYLAMTGGQSSLLLGDEDESGEDDADHGIVRIERTGPLPVLKASEQERASHDAMLDVVAKASGGEVLWRGGT